MYSGYARCYTWYTKALPELGNTRNGHHPHAQSSLSLQTPRFHCHKAKSPLLSRDLPPKSTTLTHTVHIYIHTITHTEYSQYTSTYIPSHIQNKYSTHLHTYHHTYSTHLHIASHIQYTSTVHTVHIQLHTVRIHIHTDFWD